MMAAAMTYGLGIGHADVGGYVPGPGVCDYPAVGSSGLDGPGVYHYVCDYPEEINGSHHHCQYGGAATLLTLGASVLFVSGSIQTATGILEGACWWACPDLSISAPPNPVSAWSNSTPIKASKCKTVAPNPLSPPEVPNG
jgi:hypothetical protein